MNKKIKMNYFFVFIVLVLILLLFISVINLFSIIKLKKQTDAILSNNLSINYLEKREQGNVSSLVKTPPRKEADNPSSGIINNYYGLEVYSNLASEPFFNKALIDLEKTNLYFDEKATALTFAPVYNFVFKKYCTESFCGLSPNKNEVCLDDKCLKSENGEIYYNNRKINLPKELNDKEVFNISIDLLEKKWAVSFLFNDDGQDQAFVYMYDGRKMTPLINDDTEITIRTSFGKTGGNIGVGGDDNNFIVLYSGYEGIAFLYKNGTWKNISQYLGLRMMDGGFDPVIIKNNDNKLDNWYICSDSSKPKLIKLWQNGTGVVEGGIDLSHVLKEGESHCYLEEDNKLSVVKEKEVYIFEDDGFDNSKIYNYQSINLNKFIGKKIILASLDSFFINSQPDLCSLFFSVDGEKWQETNGELTDLNGDGDELFVRVELRPADSNYSPWLDGLNVISYKAID